MLKLAGSNLHADCHHGGLETVPVGWRRKEKLMSRERTAPCRVRSEMPGEDPNRSREEESGGGGRPGTQKTCGETDKSLGPEGTPSCPVREGLKP